MANDTGFVPDVRVDAVNCSLVEMPAPYSYRVNVKESIQLYILLQGKMWLSCGCGDDAPWEILPGTTVAFSQAVDHEWFHAYPGCQKAEVKPIRFTNIDSEPHQDYIVGSAEVKTPRFFVISVPETTNQMPDIIPPVFVVAKENRNELPGLWPLLTLFLGSRVRSMDRGGALQQRLAEAVATLLMISALNKAAGLNEKGPEAGYYDQRIRRVLSVLHGNFEQEWTLDQLAELANMSRSGLSDRFKSLVGDTPLNYLNRLRMQRASSLLRTSTLSIQQISEVVGYHSESSFHKAFGRRVGYTPGKYRQLVRKGVIQDFGATVLSGRGKD